MSRFTPETVSALRRCFDREPRTWKLGRCLRAIDLASLVKEGSVEPSDLDLAERGLIEGLNQALSHVARGREYIDRSRRALQENMIDMAKRPTYGDAFRRAIEERLQALALMEEAAGLEED